MKYTFEDMKRINENIGECYFSESSMKAWGSKLIDTFDNGLFIETIKGAHSGRVAYVKIFTSIGTVCSLEYFTNTTYARKYVAKLNKALEENLGFREKETLKNVSYVYCKEDSENEYLEFTAKDLKDCPSHSFTMNQNLQVVG